MSRFRRFRELEAGIRRCRVSPFPYPILYHDEVRGCLKSRLRVADHRRVMPITINTDRLCNTDLTDAAWALIAPMLPAARRVGRPRTTNIRAVLNAIFYLLRTGCQWRLLRREFPVWSTVYHYFRAWKNGGVWTFRNVKGSFRFLSFLSEGICSCVFWTWRQHAAVL
jgi:hypothetical protein